MFCEFEHLIVMSLNASQHTCTRPAAGPTTPVSLATTAWVWVSNITGSDKLEEQVMWYAAAPPWQEMVKKKKALLGVIREELMQKAWHPARLKSCLSHDEVREIFGPSA